MKPLKIVYCYARKDKKLRERLENHLEALRRSKLITSWHDASIMPGADWEEEILFNINTADIILLIVSHHFISSDYCYKEMQKALERRKTGNVYVIPVIARPVEWKVTPLGAIQALPDQGKPITLWRNQDEAFFNVVQGIKKVLEEIQKERIQKERGAVQSNSQGINYFLNTKKVTLKGGKAQTIYYFSKDLRWETACGLPPDFVVRENPRNGFFTMRRSF